MSLLVSEKGAITSMFFLLVNEAVPPHLTPIDSHSQLYLVEACNNADDNECDQSYYQPHNYNDAVRNNADNG
ncbi:MAG: hypothetical protein ACI84C_002991 [Flavobacteriales bacterium]|jgi:hypothetical protein